METQNFKQKTIGIIDNPKNKKLISNLEKQGNAIVRFPEFEKHSMKTDANLFENLIDYDWLIFTDIYSVEYFLQTLDELGMDPFDLDVLRICAVGEAVADALRFRQIHSDVVPNKNRTETVISGLRDYVFVESEFSELKFLIIKESSAETELANSLKDLNAYVTEFSIYRIVQKHSLRLSKLKALVKGGGIDEFVFTSPEDVFIVSGVFNGENLGDVFAEIKITTSDEVTAQTFREFSG